MKKTMTIGMLTIMMVFGSTMSFGKTNGQPRNENNQRTEMRQVGVQDNRQGNMMQMDNRQGNMCQQMHDGQQMRDNRTFEMQPVRRNVNPKPVPQPEPRPMGQGGSDVTTGVVIGTVIGTVLGSLIH